MTFDEYIDADARAVDAEELWLAHVADIDDPVEGAVEVAWWSSLTVEARIGWWQDHEDTVDCYRRYCTSLAERDAEDRADQERYEAMVRMAEAAGHGEVA